MKKRMLIAGIAVLAIFIFSLKKTDLYIWSKNQFNHSKLPDEFANYLDLSSHPKIRFGNSEMKLMFESFEPIRHYLSSKNNLIMITSSVPDEPDETEPGGGTRIRQDFHFYKLDRSGNVIDSIIFKRSYKNGDELLFDDYIVNPSEEYYRTWMLDGDTSMKKIAIQNKDLKWNDEQQNELCQQIVSNAQYYKVRRYSPGEITYFLDGRWSKAFINTKLPIELESGRGETTYDCNVFRHYSAEEMKKVPNRYQYLRPVYFQRMEFEALTSSIGGGSISSSFYIWTGNLLCQLNIDSDTLKFKIPIIFTEELANQQFFEAVGTKIADYKDDLEKAYTMYLYYTNDNMDFKLFTDNDHRLYMIKSAYSTRTNSQNQQ